MERFRRGGRKKQWFGAGEAWSAREWSFDFRVGGRDVDEAKFHGGPVSRYEAEYTNIVDRERIVTTYNMWIDGAHISTSVASFEFETMESGTRLTQTEHGIHFDGFDTGEQREAGSRGLLDALGEVLAR